MMGSDLPYYSISIPHENDESFIADFETIVLRLRRNIMIVDFFNIRNFVYKEYGPLYNHINIIEVDLFTDSSRSSDCIDQILKAIKDSEYDNHLIKSKFSELLQSNITDICRDDIVDEIFRELMDGHEHVLIIIENFNYYSNHICDNDYYRLTRLCCKKYSNKLSFALTIDSKKDFKVVSLHNQNFIMTFKLDDIESLSSIPSNKILYNNPLKKQNMETPEVYISYAWTSESEEILNELRATFDENDVKYYVDKKDIEYRGNIREFEERLGKGDYIILIISDKFLKSKDCMYEVLQIMNKGGDISKRIFPIVLPDAKIYDPEHIIDYVKHWEEKKASLNDKMKTIGTEFLPGLHLAIDNYTKYREIIDKIITILKEMNNLSPDIHRDSKFKQLIDSLKDQQSLNEKKDIIQKEFQNMNSRSINQYGSKSVYIEKNEGDVKVE
jgi:hypothetical protein